MRTMELMANLTERRPSASALPATAVFTDNIDTKTPAMNDIQVVINFFMEIRSLSKLSSYLSDDETPSAR